MDGSEFAKHLLKIGEDARKFINDDSPEIMGKTAVDFFKQSFHDEGFTNGGLQKWQEVKRRMDPPAKGAKGSRLILTGDTGDLGRSIGYRNGGNGEVTVYSDLTYAAAHNEGTTNAGRNRNVTLPKRQFMGHSAELDKLILDELKRKLDPLMQGKGSTE